MLDDAGYTGRSTRQHEVQLQYIHHTSNKIGNRSALKDLHHEVEIDPTDDAVHAAHTDHTDHTYLMSQV